MRKRLDHLHLAEGEVTGHFHGARAGTLYDLGNGVYDFIPPAEGTEVDHQEHGTVTVPGIPHERHLVQTVDEDEEIRAIRD
jgi:hypothetical protein